MVRRKERYFVCEVIDPNAVDRPHFSTSSSSRPFLSKDALLSALIDSIRDCHGVYGLALLEPERGVVRIKHVNPGTSLIILRCLRAHHRLFWSALTFVRSIAGKDCFLNTLYVGATLRSCEAFVIKHHRKKLTEELGKTNDATKRIELQKMIVASCQVAV